MRVAGLDPSGTEKRFSGLAVLDNNELIYINRLKHDAEIIETVLLFKPLVLAIDSPLSHADGYREVDLVMKKHGFKVLPPGWRGMRRLIDRSIKFKEVFEKSNIFVIETHPYSALKSSNCVEVHSLLRKHGIEVNRVLTRDEYDALIAALVAKYYVENRALVVKAHDGAIYLLPRIC